MVCKSFSLEAIAMLIVSVIAGPDTAKIGNIVTYTATVTNTGIAPGSATVTFYEGNSGTTISIKGTGTIAPGGTEKVPTDIDTLGWAIGTYNICAKTNYE